jgi:uncharacterized protein (DUF1499 family)
MAGTVVVALVVLALGAGQVGLLAGSAPTDLGVAAGRLKAPSHTANSVSSQAGLWAGHPMQQAAAVAPLPLRGTPTEAITRLRAVVQAMPGAEVVTQRDDYLYVRFSTRLMGFVDDADLSSKLQELYTVLD